MVLVALAALLSTFYRRNVTTALTHSGELAVYGTDLFGLAAAAYLAWSLVSRRPRTRFQNQYLVVVGLFAAYCAAVSAARFLQGHSDLQSLQVPRSDLMTVWVVFAVAWCGLRRQTLLLASAVFTLVLSTASVAMSGSWAAYTFSYWQSNSIRTDLLAILLPVSVMAVLRVRGKAGQWLTRANLVVHVIGLSYCVVVSGSRLGAVLVPALLLACVAVLVQQRQAVVVALCVAAASASLVGLYLTQNCSVVINYGISRSPGFGGLLKAGDGWPGLCSHQPGTSAPTSASRQQPAQPSPSAKPSPAATPSPTASSRPTSTTAATQSTSPADPASSTPTATKSSTGSAKSTTVATVPSPGLDADTSKEESTQVRTIVWGKALQDIKSNWVFGPGGRQYQVSYSASSTPIVVPPHNFVLEISLAYGVAGLALWLLVLAFPVLHPSNRRHLTTAPGILALASLGFALCTALVQPLMLNPTVLFVCYFVIAVLVAPGGHEALRPGPRRRRPAHRA